MKFKLTDERLAFIPEDEADVFNLGKIAVHFSCSTHWDAKRDIPKLKNVTINIRDIYTILCMLLKDREHHFVKRDKA